MRRTFCWLAAGLLATSGLVPLSAQFVDVGWGEDDCTIGVAAGSATSDGRPLLWKTRDAQFVNNEVCYFTELDCKFIAVVTAGETAPWMGVNERGFALINANSLDLPGGGWPEHGSFMHHALGTCATVADFEYLLDSTNITGRNTQAHFGVIDTTGAAAIFETANDCYWKYDANDPAQSPDGYVLRANFAFNGSGTVGIERYRRSCNIIAELRSRNSLDFKGIIRNQMRDFSDPNSDPFSVPYAYKLYSHMPFGYVCTSVSICRAASVSAAVIQGVTQGEPAALTTMWTMLGQPAATIAIPFWPVGDPPPQVNGGATAPLCDEANRIKSSIFELVHDPVSGRRLEYANTYKLSDGNRKGVWAQTLPVEDNILAVAQGSLERWRINHPAAAEMLELQDRFASQVLAVLRRVGFEAGGVGIELPGSFAFNQSYPDPFNAVTTISYDLPLQSHVSVQIFTTLGQRVTTLVDETKEAGHHTATWDATSDRGSSVASGVYFCRLQVRPEGGQRGSYVGTKKLILMK